MRGRSALEQPEIALRDEAERSALFLPDQLAGINIGAIAGGAQKDDRALEVAERRLRQTDAQRLELGDDAREVDGKNTHWHAVIVPRAPAPRVDSRQKIIADCDGWIGRCRARIVRRMTDALDEVLARGKGPASPARWRTMRRRPGAANTRGRIPTAKGFGVLPLYAIAAALRRRRRW
jgi:hypothetical protein